MAIDFKNLPMTPEALLIEEMLMVVDKTGKEVDFVLNDAQRLVDANIQERNLLPKARQKGISTLLLARGFIKCIMNNNFQAVVVSHEKDATQRLLKRVHFFADNFHRRTGKRIITETSSANAITFAETKSTFYIGTAGSRAFGRGDTIHFFHASEYAYWENGLNLLNGILDSVADGGEIYIESTGEGVGNDYHQRCERAATKNSAWNLIFVPWHIFKDEYTKEFESEEKKEAFKNEILSSDTDPYKEKKLYLSKVLTLEQINWRRIKLEGKNFRLNLFEQEYPMTLDEAFQAGGATIFRKVNYVQTEEWQELDGNLFGLPSHPMRGHGYVIGADPSGGVGSDDTAAVIIDIITGEQVAEYVSDRTQPDSFGRKLRDLGIKYNMAYIGVESNNHGPVTLDNLRGKITDEGWSYPQEKIYDSKGNQGRMAGVEDVTLMDLGIRTTQRSKPILIGQLNRALAADEIVVHSPILKGELNTFIEHDTGKLAAASGCKDDLVMALAVANAIRDRALIYFEAEKEDIVEKKRSSDPFTFDSIFHGFSEGQTLYGTKMQHASANRGDNNEPPWASKFE